ncbi:PH domain-containing protein [Actinoplanes couchii]|uniref:Membrane protein n=1 Tax=Actinoplanes couchii TaxID=403638 RepID=A0ABQ3XGC2_9ACTN|nr:PH domain-containing protein [Actinoplanes couchii]MDR6321041.1 membrane protein YdbS with pleckstrin-like domain [Actinoplanes couchii]GID57552.1 membrane protein [Actinoplanes couchii]
MNNSPPLPRPPRRPLDRRFVLWRTVDTLIWATVVLGALGAVWFFAEVTRPWVGPVLIVLAVVYAVHVAVMPSWRYRVHRWETTDDAVYALTGWLTHKWQIVPISRIQSIDTEIGPLQRMFGLATITVTTASSEGNIEIEGVSAADAADAVDRLREVTATTVGDAT